MKHEHEESTCTWCQAERARFKARAQAAFVQDAKRQLLGAAPPTAPPLTRDDELEFALALEAATTQELWAELEGS